MPSMTMLIWWTGTLLEIIILARGYQQRLTRQFPIFYAYLLFVTLDEFVRISFYRWDPNHYSQVYWVTQYICLALGAGIIFEIYRVALRSYPGAARMTRYMLVVVFAVIVVKTLTMPSGDLFAWLASTSLVLERNLRIVQALAMFTLVSLFVWYAIPFGRNLKGILIGYGLFIAMSILQFALWYYSWDRFKPFWTYAETSSYLVVLGVWVNTLWSSEPLHEAQPVNQFESDYQSLVASTREQFRRTLARLGWVVRA